MIAVRIPQKTVLLAAAKADTTTGVIRTKAEIAIGTGIFMMSIGWMVGQNRRFAWDNQATRHAAWTISEKVLYNISLYQLAARQYVSFGICLRSGAIDNKRNQSMNELEVALWDYFDTSYLSMAGFPVVLSRKAWIIAINKTGLHFKSTNIRSSAVGFFFAEFSKRKEAYYGRGRSEFLPPLANTYYLVRWLGHGPEYDAWYHVDDLSDAKDLIEDFEKSATVAGPQQRRGRPPRGGGRRRLQRN
ncbi:uncharacterized protein TRUGW13939_03019 [Talaromyces rugulosus]|uniref:Chromo domain-containing protein n=1 Tax=Talaromyces rugulosus TaxID=121627 RepID=A0A7H8QPM3_TALRU|nr:uncharacterized protein TRUGW13939_03019 [Talaromyces rugulosus]QKX55920.1 hypothetical protein TRUGW13939_03019 [Talaromyces rugulosus]